MGYEEFCRSSPEVLSSIGIKAKGRFLLPDLITQQKVFLIFKEILVKRLCLPVLKTVDH